MYVKINSVDKLKNFFRYDLKSKKILNDIIPIDLDFYDDDGKFKYMDKLISGIEDLKTYITKMMLDYNMPLNIIKRYNTIIDNLEGYIKSPEFYILLNQGKTSVLKFIKDNISDMRIEFINSVKQELVGYTINYASDVIMPVTLNEFLHYVHNYIVNNENFYEDIPEIISSNKNKEIEWKGTFLRGIANELSNQLYYSLVENLETKSDRIDIISLEDRIIIMARDLGHAAVIEIDMREENVFVKYSIPKNNNKEMIAMLKGINENNDNYASGMFETTKEKLVYEITNFMKGIPTDSDRIERKV